MDYGYKKIFWGLILTSFHINLGPIMIIPPFIAWFFVFVGINYLLQNCTEPISNDHFFRARFFAVSITIITLLGDIISYLGKNAVWTQFIPVIVVVLELLLTYYLLEGSLNLSSDFKQHSNHLTAYILCYLVYSILFCIVITFALTNLLIITAIIGLFLRLWVLLQISKYKKTYES